MSIFIACLARLCDPQCRSPVRALSFRRSSLRSSRKGKPKPALAPMRLIAPTRLEMITQRRYCDAASLFMEPRVPAPWLSRCTALQGLPKSAPLTTCWPCLAPIPAPSLDSWRLRPLGGALQRPLGGDERVTRSQRSLVALRLRWCSMRARFRVEEQLTTAVDALEPWAQNSDPPNCGRATVTATVNCATLCDVARPRFSTASKRKGVSR
jgi:hypothetical protein